jgi:hypothetical protein
MAIPLVLLGWFAAGYPVEYVQPANYEHGLYYRARDSPEYQPEH